MRRNEDKKEFGLFIRRSRRRKKKKKIEKVPTSTFLIAKVMPGYVAQVTKK
jgi:hypothetical protein